MFTVLVSIALAHSLPESLCSTPVAKPAAECQKADCSRIDVQDASLKENMCKYVQAAQEYDCITSKMESKKNEVELAMSVRCRDGLAQCSDIECFSNFYSKLKVETAEKSLLVEAEFKSELEASAQAKAESEKKVEQTMVTGEMQRTMDGMESIIKSSRTDMHNAVSALPEQLNDVKRTVPEYLSALRSEISEQVAQADPKELEEKAKAKDSEAKETDAMNAMLEKRAAQVAMEKKATEEKEGAEMKQLEAQLASAKQSREAMIEQIRKEVEKEVRDKMKAEHDAQRKELVDKSVALAEVRGAKNPTKKNNLRAPKSSSLVETSAEKPRSASLAQKKGLTAGRGTKDEVSNLFEATVYLVKGFAKSGLDGVFGSDFTA